MKVFSGVLGVVLFFTAVTAEAQRSNDRRKWVSGDGQAIILDSLTVVPGSVRFCDTNLTGKIDLDIETGKVKIKTRNPADSVEVSYKVFPYAFHASTFHKNIELYDSNAYFRTIGVNRTNVITESREELFSTENLYKSGVISRGISFGNRQDIFVNSVLNLQMDGKLSDNLNIRASITDQNIPYQPEGNTKLVQDFDNVFIEIYNESFSMSGGDIVLQNPSSNFLRYYRNVQGASLAGKYQLGSGNQAESRLAVSVSKGKFSSYQLKVMDGVMGPYKIYGPESSGYIIIVANSERVYLDGRLLVRGFNNHYVIDYNTAEITFTSQVMITKFSRVQIDFEYTNQAYNRSVIAASHHQNLGKLNVSVNYYREKDNPDQPVILELSDLDKQILSMTDPSAGNAALPGWDSVGYDENRILYKKTDTTGASGEMYTVFVHSTNTDSALYQVTFSEVPPGKGNYLLKPANLNGRIYEWVSPVNGVPQGNYEPVKTIPLPDQKQMVSFQTDYEITRHMKLFTELAVSDHRDNLFNKAEGGRKGLALKTGLRSQDHTVSFLPGYLFMSQIDYEFNDADFKGIERFRAVEFERDWSNIHANAGTASDDHIFTVRAGLKRDNRNFLDIGISRRSKRGYVDGWQSKVSGMQDMKRWNFFMDLFLLNNNNGINHSRWTRYHVATYFKSRFLYPGYELRIDRNYMTRSDSDSILYSADNFEEHRFFIKNNDSLKTRFNISYTLRKDRLPEFGEMVNRNIARTGNLMVGTQKGKLGQLDMNITYRALRYLGNLASPDLKSLMGRLDWSATYLKRHVRSELMYAIGNGRELKREYIFIPVPTGEGTHTWRDDNQDGRQDLDEFYLAVNHDERNFIKLFTPTNDYVLAYDNRLNYRLSVEMPRGWKGQSGWKGFLGRFSNNLNVNLQQKTADNRFVDNLFFHRAGLAGGSLLSYRDNIRNNLYFNRADPRYGFELMTIKTRNKQLLSEGFEIRNLTTVKGISRISISRDYGFRLTLGQSGIENSSDYLSNRNYYILSRTLEGSFEWQPSNKFRLSTHYTFSNNNNEDATEPGPERSLINEALLNFKFAKAANRNIELAFRYTYIDFEGTENSAVGYELLKALQPGQNITWTLNWQQKLLNGLQMNIFYEGRKSGELDVIHIGRMQVMAMF